MWFKRKENIEKTWIQRIEGIEDTIHWLKREVTGLNMDVDSMRQKVLKKIQQKRKKESDEDFVAFDDGFNALRKTL